MASAGLIALLTYAVTGFCQWEFNPRHWPVDVRVATVALVFFASIIVLS